MIQSPEDDRLGPGAGQCNHPGSQHHPPEQREASDYSSGYFCSTYIALFLCFEISRDERGFAMLMYLKNIQILGEDALVIEKLRKTV